MGFKTFIFILFFSLFSHFSAQSNKDISELKNYYRSFEFNSLISKADSVLEEDSNLNDTALIEIYTLKAASYYNLGDMDNSRKNFVEILKIQHNYQLDPQQFSPKIQSYFGNIKSEFQEIRNIDSADTENRFQSIPAEFNENILSRTAMIKSLILPGLGHFDMERSTKGWILSAAAVLTLGSMSYYIADTYSKEEKYLTEKNPVLLQSAYDSYNSSYKIRNSLIIAYAAIWIYSQIDMLFWSNDPGTARFSFSHNPNSYGISINDIEFSLKLSF